MPHEDRLDQQGEGDESGSPSGHSNKESQDRAGRHDQRPGDEIDAKEGAQLAGKGLKQKREKGPSARPVAIIDGRRTKHARHVDVQIAWSLRREHGAERKRYREQEGADEEVAR